MIEITMENQQNRMQEAAKVLVELANQQSEEAEAAGRNAFDAYRDPDISVSDLLRSVLADMGTKAFDRWEEDVLDDAAQQAHENAERAKYLAEHGNLDGFDVFYNCDPGYEAEDPAEAIVEPIVEVTDAEGAPPRPRPAFLSVPSPDDDDGYLDEVVQQDIQATNQRIDRYIQQFTAARVRQTTGQVGQRPTACAVSGQTAGAQHKTVGGDDDGASDPDAAPVTIIAPVAPEDLKDTPQYNARRATLARAKKLAELAAQGRKYKDMDLTPGPAGNCDTGIGHGSTLETLSRVMVDPDPLDQIIPDPHKAAAEAPGPDGKSQQRPYHRFLRKSILTQKNPAATVAQKMLADRYLQMALPGLVAAVRAHTRATGLRGVDVDGVVQHLIHKVFVQSKFDQQPNVNVPLVLGDNLKNINQAITFSNFSVEDASHQDASRYTDRPDVDDDDDGDSGNHRLEKAAFRARRDEHKDETPEERLRAGHLLDAGPVADATLGVDRFAAPVEDHDETNAERRARQTADERRAIALKRRLLDALNDLPADRRAAEIQRIAEHLAQHPDPLLLTLLRNDSNSKHKNDRDPVTVTLLDAVSRAVRFAEAESLFKPKPTLDEDLEMFATGDLDALADNRHLALDALRDKHGYPNKGNLVSALHTRMENKKGKFSKAVQQVARILLKDEGDGA
ncbi:hypothetical protein [Acidithiobacillus sp.]